MIKMIASDLDGTILLNGAQSVDESLFHMIDKLTDMGIIFIPASGRQFESLKMLFAPVADNLMYIAENGALVKYKGKVISKTPMERKLAMEIIRDVYEHDHCEVLASGEKTAYIKPKTELYMGRMKHVVKYDTTVVDRFEDIEEDILKVSVCDMSGIDHSKEYFMNKWQNQTAVAVSGDMYLDFTDLKASKGSAMKHIQEAFGISPDECMAFGDNYNDIQMLDSVVHSYAMEKAVEEVKQHANHTTDWVEGTLKKIFL